MIPLSVPNISGNEWQYVKECLDTEWLSSAGKYVDLFEQNIAEYTGAKYAVACVNGTSALQVSLRLAGVQTGDEVIIPTLTFIAPVNAVAYNGANPVFMDVDEHYNLNIEKTIEFIRTETVFKAGNTYNKKSDKLISAIVPVHMWGNGVWLDELVPLCLERNIIIVEDACESLGSIYFEGVYKGCHTGSIGNLGCLSFNGNKIITTGGGGMILTDDEELANKARYLTTQAKDDPVRYIHHEIGYNFRLTNIQAALGVAQLEQLPKFLKHKRDIFHQYQTALNDVDGMTIANVPDYADNNHWMNLIQINSEVYGEDRETLMQRLGQNGIETRPVWALNHLQRSYRDCQNYMIDKATELVEKSLCLPSSTNMTDRDIEKLLNCLGSNTK
jgi:aminotransferase in exopolysaccharide biosynthesis